MQIVVWSNLAKSAQLWISNSTQVGTQVGTQFANIALVSSQEINAWGRYEAMRPFIPAHKSQYIYYIHYI